LAGETEVLVENLPQCRYVYHKCSMTGGGIELGPPQLEAGWGFFLISSRCVTRDEVWIGNWIYWTFTLITTNNYDSLAVLHTAKSL
jgi:hypothetical protein